MLIKLSIEHNVEVYMFFAEGRITRKNLVHFRRNLKQKSYRKIQKSYKNPKNLWTILNNF